MTHVGHPFATAGGGTLFEYKVATLLAADLIRSRLTEHRGVVVALELQTGPPGFDDLQISVELLGEGHRTVHAQCRHRQPFTATDAKFATLLNRAGSAIAADEASFASGERGLAIIVDHTSPGHDSMTALCELARASGDLTRFVSSVEAHAGGLMRRWNQCLQAADSTELELLQRILAVLDVRAVDVSTAESRDSLELINRLAEAWDPPNRMGAVNLGNALFTHLTGIGPVAGAIDLQSLQTHLRGHLPRTLGATTRRARLGRQRDAGLQRIALTLRAIGLDDDEAIALAVGALETPPSVTPPTGLTVITGAMGVGKTTELERLHRQAIDQALEDTNAAIPLFLHASEVGSAPLLSTVDAQTSGLGDPSRVGVHLIIDGLDEAGIGMSDLRARVATLLATWPNSTVVTASRPDDTQHGQRVEVLESLSQEVAVQLMAAIHHDADRWLPSRAELSEVLRRPLFAIRYALDRRTGNPAGVHEAQLVESVGRQAVSDLGDRDEGVFELLVRLACLIVDSGGQPIDVRSLEATPVQIRQIMRSRIVHAVDGCASFQLAALTEWFAAHALLRDRDALEHSVSDRLRAHRWRYALVQALLQGSSEQVDLVMSTLLTHAPATAAWAHHEAQAPWSQARVNPPAESAMAAGGRVRRAARAWIEPWPGLIERWTVNGSMPALGVAMNGNYLVTAWRKVGDASEPVIPLPPSVHPLSRFDDGWTGSKAGTPRSGEMWPWDLTRDHVQQQIDEWLKHRDLLAEIEVCWPELAWDYAHRILHRDPVVRSESVPRADLAAAVSEVRSRFPDGDVQVERGRHGWRLTEAEAFVRDLARLGIHEVSPPWPPANTRGKWTWSWWTTEQLMTRLSLATKAGLDAYQAIVERLLPTMAPELDTYQMLPARIVGTVSPDNPSKGYQGQPGYSWYLEPLPLGSSNESHWRVGDPHSWTGDSEWEQRIAEVRAMRGDVAEHIRLTTHGGAPQILSSTPAGSLALDLLTHDLAAFHWTTRSGRLDMNSGSTRPWYTK